MTSNVITRWAAGVTVVMSRWLVPALRVLPAVPDARELTTVFEMARRSTTWNPTSHGRC